MTTLEKFQQDYHSSLFNHYVELQNWNSAEEYIKDCMNDKSTIFDFAAKYGARAAEYLLRFYEKEYNRTILVDSPPVKNINSAHSTNDLSFHLCFKNPVFIAFDRQNFQGRYLLNQKILCFSEFQFIEPETKDEKVCQKWHEALVWAKRIEDVWTKKMPISEFIKVVQCEFGKSNPDFMNSLHEDPDRPTNLIIYGDRFNSILHGSNSLWAFLTDTDFDVDDDVIIPSGDEIEEIEEQIIAIHERLLKM